jgi:hypothetical protein
MIVRDLMDRLTRLIESGDIVPDSPVIMTFGVFPHDVQDALEEHDEDPAFGIPAFIFDDIAASIEPSDIDEPEHPRPLVIKSGAASEKTTAAVSDPLPDEGF